MQKSDRYSTCVLVQAYASLRGYDLYVWVHDAYLVNRFPHIIGCGQMKL
ncbi:hypothetical protein [Acinetobacter pittii]|nr:hypothetical protein [Acinetobacter pittii]